MYFYHLFNFRSIFSAIVDEIGVDQAPWRSLNSVVSYLIVINLKLALKIGFTTHSFKINLAKNATLKYQTYIQDKASTCHLFLKVLPHNRSTKANYVFVHFLLGWGIRICSQCGLPMSAETILCTEWVSHECLLWTRWAEEILERGYPCLYGPSRCHHQIYRGCQRDWDGRCRQKWRGILMLIPFDAVGLQALQAVNSCVNLPTRWGRGSSMGYLSKYRFNFVPLHTDVFSRRQFQICQHIENFHYIHCCIWIWHHEYTFSNFK